MSASVPGGDFELCPRFIDGARGRLFACHYRVAQARESVLYLPPFAEELNRCRRMAALAARALAARNISMLSLDPYGCGDSEGDFAEARWDGWIADAQAAIAVLGVDQRVTLLGARLGALLALDVANRSDCTGVILWQPVTAGATHITQLLRVRIAADATRGADARETTRDLRARLAQGETLEVGGYVLAPDLVRAIDACSLDALGRQCARPIHWLDVVSEAGAAAASARIVEAWRAAGVGVSHETVAGPPFWSLQESALAPALVAATAARFASMHDARETADVG